MKKFQYNNGGFMNFFKKILMYLFMLMCSSTLYATSIVTPTPIPTVIANPSAYDYCKDLPDLTGGAWVAENHQTFAVFDLVGNGGPGTLSATLSAPQLEPMYIWKTGRNGKKKKTNLIIKSITFDNIFTISSRQEDHGFIPGKRQVVCKYVLKDNVADNQAVFMEVLKNY